jgi:hypothetical protein
MERPILFSGAMVRAILAGTKTVTRRIVKPQPDGVDGATWVREGTGHVPCRDELSRGTLDQIGPTVWCPYGEPGDRLWVRETWSHDAPSIDEARARHEDALGFAGESMPCGPYYRATEEAPDTLRWIPSIHMPRWASRILLDVVSVRVERLHEITEDDARAEGVERDRHWDEADEREADRGNGYQPPLESSVSAFARLWDFINSKRAPWASNPWVWRVEFRRCSDA